VKTQATSVSFDAFWLLFWTRRRCRGQRLGHFEEALAVSDPSRPREFDRRRLANRNIFAAANFHLGNHEAAIASFREAEERGDPFSALSLMYLSAAHQALGVADKALGLVREMEKAWPNFWPERLVPTFISIRNMRIKSSTSFALRDGSLLNKFSPHRSFPIAAPEPRA